MPFEALPGAGVVAEVSVSPARSRTSSRHSSTGRKRAASGHVSSDDGEEAEEEDANRTQVRVTPKKRVDGGAGTSGSGGGGTPDRPSTSPSTGSNKQSGSGMSLGQVVPVATDPVSHGAVRRPIMSEVIRKFLFLLSF